MGLPIVTDKDFISILDRESNEEVEIDVRNKLGKHPRYPSVTYRNPTVPMNTYGGEISLEFWKILMKEDAPSYVMPSDYMSVVIKDKFIPYIEIHFTQPKHGYTHIIMTPVENDSFE
jgi:hypothetical protein